MLLPRYREKNSQYFFLVQLYLVQCYWRCSEVEMIHDSFINGLKGCLGGSAGYVSNFGSGQDLTVCGFKHHIGLYDDSSEAGACFGF